MNKKDQEEYDARKKFLMDNGRTCATCWWGTSIEDPDFPTVKRVCRYNRKVVIDPEKHTCGEHEIGD